MRRCLDELFWEKPLINTKPLYLVEAEFLKMFFTLACFLIKILKTNKMLDIKLFLHFFGIGIIFGGTSSNQTHT